MVTWLEAHVEQAEHNIGVFNNLHPIQGHRTHNDWKITTLFYTALHLAHAHVVIELSESVYHQALLTKQNHKLTNHRDFNSFINPHSPSGIQGAKLNTTYSDYEQLYILSRKARYLEGLALNIDNFDRNINQPRNANIAVINPGFCQNMEWITNDDLIKSYNHTLAIISFFQINHQNLSVRLNDL